MVCRTQFRRFLSGIFPNRRRIYLWLLGTRILPIRMTMSNCSWVDHILTYKRGKSQHDICGLCRASFVQVNVTWHDTHNYHQNKSRQNPVFLFVHSREGKKHKGREMTSSALKNYMFTSKNSVLTSSSHLFLRDKQPRWWGQNSEMTRSSQLFDTGKNQIHFPLKPNFSYNLLIINRLIIYRRKSGKSGQELVSSKKTPSRTHFFVSFLNIQLPLIQKTHKCFWPFLISSVAWPEPLFLQIWTSIDNCGIICSESVWSRQIGSNNLKIKDFMHGKVAGNRFFPYICHWNQTCWEPRRNCV